MKPKRCGTPLMIQTYGGGHRWRCPKCDARRSEGVVWWTNSKPPTDRLCPRLIGPARGARRRTVRNSDADLRDLERRFQTTGDALEAQAYGRALVRAGRLEPDVAVLLDRMGAEAWSAWFTAGGQLEWRPDTDKDGEHRIAEVDGAWPRDWVKDRRVRGLAVRRRPDGSPMVVRTRWVVDADGNWDAGAEDDYPVGSLEADLVLAIDREGDAGTLVDYLGWAAVEGHDPLDVLGLPERQEPDRTWRFELEQEPERGRAGRTRIHGRVLLRKAWQRRGQRWLPTSLHGIPNHIMEWLSIEEGTLQSSRDRTGAVAPALISSHESLDELRAFMSMPTSGGWLTKDEGRWVTVEATLGGRRFPPTRREVTAAARSRLVEARADFAAAIENVRERTR